MGRKKESGRVVWRQPKGARRLRLTEDCFAAGIGAVTGREIDEGWLPAGTVIEEVWTPPDASPWTEAPLGNRPAGDTYRVIAQADGKPGPSATLEVIRESELEGKFEVIAG